MRSLCSLAFAALAVAFGCSFAAASAKEYCPASVADAHRFGGVQDGLYSFVLGADGVRAVTATITAQMDGGWYTFKVPQTQISEHVDHFETPTVAFDRSDFVTPPLYVQFPAGAGRIRRWFVSAATTSGDTAGWEAKGRVSCSPPGTANPPPVKAPPLEGLVPTNPGYDLAALPAPGTQILRPQTLPPPTFDCEEPFGGASAVHAVTPDWPRGLQLSASTVVIVRLSISETGSVDDAVLWMPSGIQPIDDAALNAAKASTFKPATAFCRPVAGQYLYRAYFNARS